MAESRNQARDRSRNADSEYEKLAFFNHRLKSMSNNSVKTINTMLKKEYKRELLNGQQIPCVFKVKLYEGIGTAKGKTVVIATDTKGGCSITSRIEEVAGDICKRNRIAPEKFVFIEHRLEQPNFEETYDLVHFDWNERERRFKKPQWSSFAAEAVERITGEKIS